VLWQRSLQNLHHGVNGGCGKAAMLGRHPLHYLRGSELSTPSLSRIGASLRWTAPIELRYLLFVTSKGLDAGVSEKALVGRVDDFI